MRIDSPVLGLRPVRAARLPSVSLPKPTSCTGFPLETDFLIVSSNASSISPVKALLAPVFEEMASMSSCLFIQFPYSLSVVLTTIILNTLGGAAQPHGGFILLRLCNISIRWKTDAQV